MVKLYATILCQATDSQAICKQTGTSAAGRAVQCRSCFSVALDEPRHHALSTSLCSCRGFMHHRFRSHHPGAANTTPEAFRGQKDSSPNSLA